MKSRMGAFKVRNIVVTLNAERRMRLRVVGELNGKRQRQNSAASTTQVLPSALQDLKSSVKGRWPGAVKVQWKFPELREQIEFHPHELPGTSMTSSESLSQQKSR